MKKGKLGFTIIEVAIFLAVTGLLFLVVTIGVQNSIYQQRRNDSIQGFIEFLRTTYSEVTNVQNVVEGGGQSERAIYGRLITFGEEYDLSGKKIDNGNQIFTYSVVGDVINTPKISTDTLELLEELSTNVALDGKLVGFPESYTPRWSAEIQPVCDKEGDSCFKPLKGMVLIVRHPSSGTINTFISDQVVQINESLMESGSVTLKFTEFDFKPKTIDFCVNTSGKQEANGRADVRIFEGARSASAIELIPEDESICQ